MANEIEEADAKREAASDQLEEKLMEAHADEIEDVGADALNFGWVFSGTGITSKTTLGILHTEIDPKTGRVSHEWFP